MDWRPLWHQLPSSIIDNSRNICIVDEISSSALPFVCTVLFRILKETTGNVCFISMERPVSDLVKIIKKMGMDLTLMAIQGRFRAFDAFGDALPAPSGPGLNLLDGNAEDALTNYTFKALSNDKDHPTIIVDGLSTLLAQGWSDARLMNLVKQIEAQHSSARIIARITAGFNSAAARWLIHRADWTLIVQALSSGFNRDVHGELHSRSWHHDFSFETMLIRYTDNGVFVKQKSGSSISIQSLAL